MEKCLQEAGFDCIASEEVIQRTYETGYTHLGAAINKSTSVLTMISQDAFNYGLQKLREYLNLGKVTQIADPANEPIDAPYSQSED